MKPPRLRPKRLFRHRPQSWAADPRSRRCILCGQPAAWLGVWYPTAEYRRRLGEPPGKIRLAAYPVCARHARPAFATAIEDVILADTAADLARPGMN